MPTNRPDSEVTPDCAADADAAAPPDSTSPPDTTKIASPDPPAAALVGHPYPFLSPPTQPDDLGTLGPYRVVKLLGEGGMGFVFRCEDDALRRPVALKVMRPEVAAGTNARERFLREGRAAAAVKSDHVITIYQVGEANGVPFLAMEFLAGATLDDWLKGRGGVAPAAAIVKVAKDTLRGLGAAHDRGLIHRDIKPANLWLEAGTGRVKVLDFGLTRGTGADDVLTREGALVGTPSYMAPEQAAGHPIDSRADLFSLGVVLYRMAAGRNPFQRGDVWGTLTALAVDVPPPAGSVAAGMPPELGAFIDRLVAKLPADRPESCRAALAIIAEIEKRMKGEAALPVVVYAPPAAVAESTWAAVAEAATEFDDAPAAPASEHTPAAPRRRSVVPLAAGLLGLAVVAAGAVGLVIAMRPTPGDAAKAEEQTGEKTPRPTPTPKPPEELLIPAPGPAVKAGLSPFDALDPAKIPPTEQVSWLPKEAVAVIGSHRVGVGKTVVEPGEVVAGPNHIPVAAGGRILTFTPTARSWTVKDGALFAQELALAENLENKQFRLSFAARDGRHVAGVGGDQTLWVLAVEPGGVRIASRLAFEDHLAGRVYDFTWHPDGKRVVTTFDDGTADVWDVTTEPPTRTATWPLAQTRRWLAFAPAGDVLAVNASLPGGSLVLQRPGEANAARTIAVRPGDKPLEVAFAPDGRALYVGSIDGGGANRLWRYDLTKRQPACELVRDTPGGHAHRLAFSRDGKRLLGCTSGLLYVLDAATHGELLAVNQSNLFPNAGDIQACWADDGRHVILGQHGCVYVLRVPDAPAAKTRP